MKCFTTSLLLPLEEKTRETHLQGERDIYPAVSNFLKIVKSILNKLSTENAHLWTETKNGNSQTRRNSCRM